MIIAFTFQEAGYQIHRINPKFIKSFARSLNDRAKTDKLDSFVISLYGEKMIPSPIN